jgi:hypothetical protein
LNKTYKLLVCDVDVNLLGENINVIRKTTEVVIDANKEVGREANAKKKKI